jgi:hypothetical protein
VFGFEVYRNSVEISVNVVDPKQDSDLVPVTFKADTVLNSLMVLTGGVIVHEGQ